MTAIPPDQAAALVPGSTAAASSAARSPEEDAPITVGLAVFDTAIGPCGIAWGPAGITGMHLPEGTAAETLEGLVRRFPGATAHAVPPAIAAVIDRVVGVLDGGRDDLGDVDLDLRGRSGFECRAYSVVRGIPPGSTMTYGDVAAAIGNPGLARAVGRAMGGNPFPIVVPCHRVLGADGSIGGFSAHGGLTTKRRMLFAEGVAEREGPALFAATELYPTDPRIGPTTVSTSL
jgi:methylated-DNA-[protein]-cysteine S-methyltransferase